MLIAEELLLLAIDESSGRVRNPGGGLHYALAGALLGELDVLGRVRLTTEVSPEHRKNRVVVDDPSATGDPVLDAALTSLASRDRRPADAVRLLKKRLRETLVRRLVDGGVLRRERRRVLGLFPLTRYPVVNRTPATEARAMVARHFADVDATPDPRTACLAACLAVAGLVRRVVPEVHPMLTRQVISRRAREHVRAHWFASAARSAHHSDASASG